MISALNAGKKYSYVNIKTMKSMTSYLLTQYIVFYVFINILRNS